MERLPRRVGADTGGRRAAGEADITEIIREAFEGAAYIQADGCAFIAALALPECVIQALSPYKGPRGDAPTG